MPSLKEDLLRFAHDIGIDLIGVCSPDPFDRYLAELENRKSNYVYRYAPRIENWKRLAQPKVVLPDAKAVVVIGFYFLTREPPVVGARGKFGRIVSHGHLGILKRAKRLAEFLEIRGYKAILGLHRKEAAVRAGLGSIGGNGLVVNKQFGSWVAYQCIVTDAELAADAPDTTDLCGDCTKCLDACPTQALREPYRLDPQRCVTSLLTSREIAREHWEQMPNYIMGCDLCQESCPINLSLIPRDSAECAFPECLGTQPSLEFVLDMDEQSFQMGIMSHVYRQFTGSPIVGAVMRNIFLQRLYCRLATKILGGKELVPDTFVYATEKLDAYQRNALLAIGNGGSHAGEPQIRRFLHHPTLGKYAQWAMERRSPCQSIISKPREESSQSLS